MKYSEAMLKGFEMVEGRQCAEAFAIDKHGIPMRGPGTPHAVCAHGAAMLALYGNANHDEGGEHPAVRAFATTWGNSLVCLNNGWDADGNRVGLPMEWQEIYGMAVAAGL